MEKAILKTLIYADIFDYPLTVFEVHKWLIGRKVNLRQLEKGVKKLNHESRIMNYGGYYFLPKRDGLIIKRKRREKQSAKFLRKAKILAWFLKLIPWIKLVGVSGGLAMGNASKSDDIDLFIITSKNRIWLTRLLTLGFLTLIGQRRKVLDKNVSGKICLNTLLEEDKLEQTNKDIYTAHEVLQMKVLWERDRVYSEYLLDNEWAFKFLPNWVGNGDTSLRGPKGRSNLKKRDRHASLAMTILERLAQGIQLKIMRKPQGQERIQDGALYFHPKDYRGKILALYKEKMKNLISP